MSETIGLKLLKQAKAIKNELKYQLEDFGNIHDDFLIEVNNLCVQYSTWDGEVLENLLSYIFLDEGNEVDMLDAMKNVSTQIARIKQIQKAETIVTICQTLLKECTQKCDLAMQDMSEAMNDASLLDTTLITFETFINEFVQTIALCKTMVQDWQNASAAMQQ